MGSYTGKSGAQILCQMLARHGVGVVFGYPGAAIGPILDQLDGGGPTFVLNRHEQASGHCADAYARASGRPGVCIIPGGPGATNMITPLATAHMDSSPMVVFTGQVATGILGTDATTEIDVSGIVRPCVKWGFMVRDVRDLPRAINEAMAVAVTGRPGPVVVDLPVDVQAAVCDEDVNDLPRAHVLANQRPAKLLDEGCLERAAEIINASERPVLYAGGGVILSGASGLLRELARHADIPCTTTLLGLGAFDETDPLSLHMLGMHGSAYANYAVQESDCLVAVGARFDDRVTSNLSVFAPHARVIHIDIDPASINKLVRVDVELEGDAAAVLARLTPLIEARRREDWLAKVESWKRRHPFYYADDSPHPKPQYVIEEICRQTRGEAILATGVGQHQMWSAQFYRWRYPRRLITSGGLGTMGYGLPASIGAAMASGGHPVFDIDGDGSFTMTCQELGTIAQYNIPVKIVVLNNHYLGMVKQWQDLFYHARYSKSILKNPSFTGMAEAHGIRGIRCEGKENVARTVAAMLEHDGPMLAEVMVEPEEHVYPMVGPGKGLHEIEFGSARRLGF